MEGNPEIVVLIDKIKTFLRVIILAAQKQESDYGLDPSISESITILNEMVEKLIKNKSN